MKNWLAFTDFTAMGCSALCVAHCTLLPIALLILPSGAALSTNDEMFHRLLIVAVIPISLVALTIGSKKHGNVDFFRLGLVGLGLLIFAGFFGHSLLGEMGEKIVTIIGSGIIAFSHLKNYRLCQSLQSSCDIH